MDRTLGEHVRALEERMNLVSEQIMQEKRFKQTQPPGIRIASFGVGA